MCVFKEQEGGNCKIDSLKSRLGRFHEIATEAEDQIASCSTAKTLWNSSVVVVKMQQNVDEDGVLDDVEATVAAMIRRCEKTDIYCMFVNLDINQKISLFNILTKFASDKRTIECTISIAILLKKEGKIDRLSQFIDLIEIVDHRFHDRKSSNRENGHNVSRDEWECLIQAEMDNKTFLTNLKNDMNQFIKAEENFTVKFRDVHCGLSHFRRHRESFKKQLEEDKVSMESYIGVSESHFIEKNLIRIQFMANGTIKFFFTWQPGMFGVLSKKFNGFYLSTMFCNRKLHESFIKELATMKMERL